MKLFLNIFFLLLISCNGKSQETNVNLSKGNISYQEFDKETGWKRILLIKPNKWGFVNNKNEIMIPFVYDFVNPFKNGLAYVENNGKKFFITLKNLNLANDFDEVRIFTFGLAAVSKNNKWGFIDETGKLVIPMIYDEVGYFDQNSLSSVSKNGKSGFINKKGVEIIPIIYEMVKSEQLDDLVIVRKNYKWAFFDSKGKLLSDFLYNDVQSAWKGDKTTFFENGPASVKKNGKYSFISKDLKPAFSNLVFDSATSFDSKRNAIVMNKGKFGIIKNDGKIAVPLQYDLIENFNSNGNPNPQFYNFKKGNIYGLWNRNLKIIGESREEFYDRTYSNQIAYISFKNLKGKYGLVNAEGVEQIPFIYDESLNFDGENFSIAEKNHLFGMIDINNKELIPFKYTEFSKLDTDKNFLFIVSNKSETRIINLENKTILSGYKSIQSIFNDPLKFIVQKDKKFGIIDINHKIILPLEYDEISNWTEYGPEHSKFIKKNGKIGLIDEKTFKITIPPIYDEFRYNFGLIFVKKNNKAGIINEEGKIICDFIYDEIYPNLSDFYRGGKNEQRIYAKKGNSFFQIDATGKILKSNLTEKFVKDNYEIPPPPPPKQK
jgi:hypothetical protein